MGLAAPDAGYPGAQLGSSGHLPPWQKAPGKHPVDTSKKAVASLLRAANLIQILCIPDAAGPLLLPMPGHLESPHVPSTETALACFAKVLGSPALSPAAATALCDYDPSDKTIGFDELREITAQHGFRLNAERLTWRQLLAADFGGGVVLILRNQNAVSVLQSKCNRDDQIVVSDPLYRGGEAFLLPRDALERVWDGDALILNRCSPRFSRKTTWILAILAGCLLSTEIFVHLLAAPGAMPDSTARLDQISSPQLTGDANKAALLFRTSLSLANAHRLDGLSAGVPAFAFAENLVVGWSTSKGVGALAAQEFTSSLASASGPLTPRQPGERAIGSVQVAVLRPQKLFDREPTPPASSDRRAIRSLVIALPGPARQPTPPKAPGLDGDTAARARVSVENPVMRQIPYRFASGGYFADRPAGSALIARNWRAGTEGTSSDPLSSSTNACEGATLSSPDAAGVPVRICK